VSTFSGLNIASTALRAQQRAIDVTGQNVANVNTDGYSRQRVELQSVGASTVPAIYAVSNGIGNGVSADQVIRMRDTFLEGRAQVEHGRTAELTVADDTLTQIEDAFREPGTTGIQSMMSDLWAGFDAVANAPGNLAARSQLLERAGTLASGIRTTSATLAQQWDSTHESLGALVRDANATADTIADLNAAIRSATQQGLPTNELSDKRDSLVLSLSDAIGATSSPGEFGAVNVRVGGASLISGSSVLHLALVGGASAADATPDPSNPTAPTNPPTIVTSPGNTAVQVGGTAGGQLTALAGTIPGYLKSLNEFARNLADVVNTQHQAGADLGGNDGKALFGPADGKPLTAANFTVAITSTQDVAAGAKGPKSLDNSNADLMSQLGAKGLDASYRQIITALGVQSAVASRNVGIQTVITRQVDNDRESVSGVSLDEEMTNLMSYQHGYSAAARMVTTIDEMIDVLINKTGLVGR
jgi:flagellar hook-associated protein 1 FlgK